MATRKHISKSDLGKTAKDLATQADDVIYAMEGPMLALLDFGQHIKDCPFEGHTMRVCITSLTARIRTSGALLPIPDEPKAAKSVRALLREWRETLDDLDEGAALLLDDRFDPGINSEPGAVALEKGIHCLVEKAGAAFQCAAASMGADQSRFCCEPREEGVAA